MNSVFKGMTRSEFNAKLVSNKYVSIVISASEQYAYDSYDLFIKDFPQFELKD